VSSVAFDGADVERHGDEHKSGERRCPGANHDEEVLPLVCSVRVGGRDYHLYRVPRKSEPGARPALARSITA
jgi:hypothetical protein